MSDTLDRAERRKDTIQVAIESGALHVGQIAGIVVHAVRDVTRELGDWATDLFEIRDAARRAEQARQRELVELAELPERTEPLARG